VHFCMIRKLLDVSNYRREVLIQVFRIRRIRYILVLLGSSFLIVCANLDPVPIDYKANILKIIIST
jgi:hypothetical protein